MCQARTWLGDGGRINCVEKSIPIPHELRFTKRGDWRYKQTISMHRGY